MPVPRKLRVALLVSVVLVAVPAATARAVARMPVGFYDDPSFRWSDDTAANLAAAEDAHASIIHVLADWSSIAPTRPRHPLNGDDPAYHLSDLDALISSAQAYDMQVLLTIAETPKWANGGQTPNHPPSNVGTLTQFARMLATRYNGTHPGLGVVNMFSVWNEPNLQQFLTPQFEGTKIVSPGIYAKLYEAAYKGIKAGNKHALVAAGETSNRGHNHHTAKSQDTVAPATFAHDLSIVAPHLKFDAWATHPYPSDYALGPTQRVAYPNVELSTMSRFGASLKQWFHRPVPIWITEYGEQTKPEYPTFGVSYAKQAADAKKALQLAAANPYVQMFIWFIFRDGPAPPAGQVATSWFSGVEKADGKKKPAYNAFSKTAKGIVGQSQVVEPFEQFSVTIAVPFMTYHDAPGARLGVMYSIRQGKKIVATGEPIVKIQSDGTVDVPIGFDPAKGKTYTMTVTFNDVGGQTETHMVELLPAS
jgi:Cellulase (glycosyl hydrolase family 5)